MAHAGTTASGGSDAQESATEHGSRKDATTSIRCARTSRPGPRNGWRSTSNDEDQGDASGRLNMAGAVEREHRDAELADARRRRSSAVGGHAGACVGSAACDAPRDPARRIADGAAPMSDTTDSEGCIVDNNTERSLCRHAFEGRDGLAAQPHRFLRCYDSWDHCAPIVTSIACRCRAAGGRRSRRRCACGDGQSARHAHAGAAAVCAICTGETRL